jgi:hypothetical protein
MEKLWLAQGWGLLAADAGYGSGCNGPRSNGILVSYADPWRTWRLLIVILVPCLRMFLKGWQKQTADAKARGLVPAFATTFALTISNR